MTEQSRPQAQLRLGHRALRTPFQTRIGIGESEGSAILTGGTTKQKVSPTDFQESTLNVLCTCQTKRKGQMVIPRTLRDEAGVSEGTLMKIAVVEGGQFLITPQVSNRSLRRRSA